jgi:methylglutaconyl-CoA hydratase
VTIAPGFQSGCYILRGFLMSDHDPAPISGKYVDVQDESSDNSVLLETTPEGVAVVLLNRPARRNAFNVRMIEALTEAFETLAGAEGVRVVFIRGAGGSFCAGADLEWMRSASGWSEEENRQDALELARMLKALRDLPMLTVALVEGSAFGGGAGLVAACDMAIASSGAVFAFSEVKLGLTPATISPYVVEAIGGRNARRLFALGGRFDAAEALRIGLVDRVTKDALEMDAAQEEVATEVMSCAPGALADAKALADYVNGREIDHALMVETAKRIAARRVSPEGREGLAAFFDRTKPSWRQ